MFRQSCTLLPLPVILISVLLLQLPFGVELCGYPGSPGHASVAFSSETIEAGTVATYTCDNGYELLGPPRRTCTENGTWIPQGIPFCGKSLFTLQSLSVSFFLQYLPYATYLDRQAISRSFTQTSAIYVSFFHPFSHVSLTFSWTCSHLFQSSG